MAKGTPQYKAIFPGLVDIAVDEQGKTTYIILENEGLVLAESVTLDEQTYVPPPKNKIPWLLPRASEVLRLYREDSDKALYLDLLEYHKSISQLPTENHYDLLVLWVLHTYLMEKFYYSPYIWFYGIPGRGKSRTGKGCIYVSYRGIHIESIREAHIIRYADRYAASLFIDTLDLWGKAKKSGAEDLLLARFEKGTTVSRVLAMDKGPFLDMTHFNIFGPTVIATNEPVHPALESRAIQINMHESAPDRKFQDFGREDALSLKERCVAFRARHMNGDLPNVDKAVGGRLGDITKPLHQMLLLSCPEREDFFLDLIRSIESDRRICQSETREAQIVVATISLESEVKNGFLSVKRITNVFNREMPIYDRLKPQQVGPILSAIGFKKKRINSGMVISYDKDMLALLMKSFGIEKST